MNPIVTGRARQRHTHRWALAGLLDGVYICESCGLSQEDYEARQLLGKRSRRRGQDYEREWSRRLGLWHVGGMHEIQDGLSDRFAGQAKSFQTGRFPGWMSTELDKLRARWADRIPILGIMEAPGSGRKPRRLIVMDEDDWIALRDGVIK